MAPDKQTAARVSEPVVREGLHLSVVVPRIHIFFLVRCTTWMRGTSPRMTTLRCRKCTALQPKSLNGSAVGPLRRRTSPHRLGLARAGGALDDDAFLEREDAVHAAGGIEGGAAAVRGLAAAAQAGDLRAPAAPVAV